MSDCPPRYTSGAASAKGAKVIEFKRGDTIALFMQALDEDGQPVPLAGYDIAAEARNVDGTLAFTFAVTLAPVDLEEGRYELWAPADPVPEVGDLRVDVQYGIPYGDRTLKRSTETFWLRIIEDVTGSTA